MKNKIATHIGLGRFFALPAALCAVLLGVALGGHWSWLTVMVCLAATFQMAYSHSFNTLLDYSWTKFDKGREEERSRPKAYTKGQQAIAAGGLSPRGVLINGLVYLAISAAFTAVVSWQVSPIIWAIWAATSLVTFWYSYGKLHYQCELALGIGFGPLAVMLGMASQPNPNFLVALLAGIPFLILWGFAAEFVDQAIDAEPNYPRGLRNLGALAWKNNISVPLFTAFLFTVAYLAQLFLIAAGILAPLTSLSLIAFPLTAYGLLILGNNFNKKGVLILLLGVFIHMIALLIGQILGG